MKEQAHKPVGSHQVPSGFDVFSVVLPLITAVVLCLGAALVPVEWILGFFILVVFVGLLVALTHHT